MKHLNQTYRWNMVFCLMGYIAAVYKRQKLKFFFSRIEISLASWDILLMVLQLRMVSLLLWEKPCKNRRKLSVKGKDFYNNRFMWWLRKFKIELNSTFNELKSLSIRKFDWNLGWLLETPVFMKVGGNWINRFIKRRN